MDLAFQLKGSLFNLSVLQLQTLNLTEIETQLSEKIKLAPKFFDHSPVVIDVNALSETEIETMELQSLTELLKKYGLSPVGFHSKKEVIQKKIKDEGLPFLHEARPTAQIRANHLMGKENKPSTPAPAPTLTPKNKIAQALKSKNTVIIDQKVRSGQQIYAPDGDLIVLSSVSSGAELLAEGNIHVYGVLRGRALAGLNGETSARIFCHKLEADLVSIAGQYKLFEERLPEADIASKGQQIHLKNGQLVISAL